MKKRLIVCAVIVTAILTTAVIATNNVQLTAYVAPFRIIVDSEEWTFENPIVTISDRTYIPLRELGERLGKNVEWDEENRTIFISNPQYSNWEMGTLYRFEQDGLVGYKDAFGYVVIEPQFAFARDFSEGLAFVSREIDSTEYRGYIDMKGNLVIPLPTVGGPVLVVPERYGFYAYDFKEGFARVVVRRWEQGEGHHAALGSWGPIIFIDRTGKNTFDMEFSSAGDFLGSYARVILLDGTDTHIDRFGRIVDWR